MCTKSAHENIIIRIQINIHYITFYVHIPILTIIHILGHTSNGHVLLNKTTV
jgi:hypothetical protein